MSPFQLLLLTLPHVCELPCANFLLALSQVQYEEELERRSAASAMEVERVLRRYKEQEQLVHRLRAQVGGLEELQRNT